MSSESVKEQEKWQALLNHFYNKYVNHYNKHNISAQSEFYNIMSLLNQRHESKKRVLIKAKKQFREELEGVCDRIDNKEDKDISSLIEYRKGRIFESLNVFLLPDKPLFPSIDEAYDGILVQTVHILSQVEGINPKDSNLPIYKKIKELNDLLVDLINVRIHMTALGLVIKKVFDKKYQIPLQAFDELEEQEKEGIKKEAFNTLDLQEDAYWQTAYELYEKKNTWKEVYKEIENLRADAGLVNKYSTFKSFKRNKHKYDKKRSSGIK